MTNHRRVDGRQSRTKIWWSLLEGWCATSGMCPFTRCPITCVVSCRPPQYYTELFYTLRSAAETDLIYLHINSPGGDFNTGLQIINNMLASEAHVVTVLEARAYSMAAFIFLSGDELIVHDNCQLMFHTYSSSFAGKGSEQLAEVHALGSWFEKVTTRLCTPFLSATDIAHILQGSDLWMDSDEIRRRLARIKPSRAKAATRRPAARKARASV